MHDGLLTERTFALVPCRQAQAGANPTTTQFHLEGEQPVLRSTTHSPPLRPFLHATMGPPSLLAIAAVCLLCLRTGRCDAAPGALRFARGYGHGMVLQHGGAGAGLWGYGPVAGEVAVRLERDGTPVWSQSVRVDSEGQWQVTLPPQQPGAALYSVVAASGGATVTLAGVLFGDVWVCSGGYACGRCPNRSV